MQKSMAKLYIPVEIQRMIISFLPLKEMVPVSIVSLAWREMVIAEGTSVLHRNFAKFLEQLIAALASVLPSASAIPALTLLLTKPAPAQAEYNDSDRQLTTNSLSLLKWQKRQVRIVLGRKKLRTTTLTEKLHPLVAVAGWKFFLTRLAVDQTSEKSKTAYGLSAHQRTELEICLAVDDIGKAKECISKKEQNWEGWKTLCFHHIKRKQPEQALEVIRNLKTSGTGYKDFETFFLVPLLQELEFIPELSFLRLLLSEPLPTWCTQWVRVSLCRLALQRAQPENARALVRLIGKGSSRSNLLLRGKSLRRSVCAVVDEKGGLEASFRGHLKIQGELLGQNPSAEGC